MPSRKPAQPLISTLGVGLTLNPKPPLDFRSSSPGSPGPGPCCGLPPGCECSPPTPAESSRESRRVVGWPCKHPRQKIATCCHPLRRNKGKVQKIPRACLVSVCVCYTKLCTTSCGAKVAARGPIRLSRVFGKLGQGPEGVTGFDNRNPSQGFRVTTPKALRFLGKRFLP